MIPTSIKIKRGELPDAPGVYLYFDREGELLYVGKATSLKRRVGSYFTKAHELRIEEMVAQIARIDYIETPTVIEALVLEANKIKALEPKYNILARDDKTFLFLVITNEPFPKPLLIRGHELRQMGVDPWGGGGVKDSRASKKFLRIFGPYTSSHSLKIALELIRKIIPWSTCEPPEVTGRVRGCFNSQIGKCPGVCTGKISQREYIRYIRQLITFFDGKKLKLERELEREMKKAAKELRFEEASVYRRRLGALQHIQDIALLSREDHDLPFSREPVDGTINLDGRIEAYDISNISGTSATGSMVVFEEGKPAKDKYRKFKIKTVVGPNDVAMMEEMIRRRLSRAGRPGRAGRDWELPVIMVIDGGLPQVNRVQAVLDELGMKVPIVGLAKGFDRKQDRLVFDRSNEELVRVATRGKELFQKARDEAHRFAVRYHRVLRAKKLLK
ncbi:MAG: excinuclease ABC subunit UvrC [Candidatus Uhrbacteria bacterium]|nr:excinuclease ABC subunit UvrC [Candidatus Uhrbacteria bacterium]